MGRRARPWYRAARRMWYINFHGRQEPLGVTDPARPDLAEQAYQRLLADLAARIAPQVPAAAHSPPIPSNSPPIPSNSPRTVREAVAGFMAKKRGRISDGALRQYHFALEVHLCNAFGDRPVSSLTAEELEDWAVRPAWSNSTRNGNLGCVMTFLRWAGHVLPISRPPKESRGADVVLSDEEFAKVLACYDDGYGGDLGQLLRFLRATGARPGEGARLRCEQVDWDAGCARIREHKTRGKTGRDRVVYLNAAARKVLDRQRERHADGFLFRTRTGRPYSGKAIRDGMARLSERAGVKAIAYGCRHGFATDALAAGVPDAVVAELLGHTSTAMVVRNYGHLAQRSQVLREAAERVAGRKAS